VMKCSVGQRNRYTRCRMETLVAGPYLAFGRWLEDVAFKKGFRPKPLADRLGVSETAVSNWFNGRRKPYKSNCYAIAEALGIESADVLKAAGYPAEVEAPERQYSERPRTAEDDRIRSELSELLAKWRKEMDDFEGRHR
jgi:transcriptional regulator with XRE-family HTH domain